MGSSGTMGLEKRTFLWHKSESSFFLVFRIKVKSGILETKTTTKNLSLLTKRNLTTKQKDIKQRVWDERTIFLSFDN